MKEVERDRTSSASCSGSALGGIQPVRNTARGSPHSDMSGATCDSVCIPVGGQLARSRSGACLDSSLYTDEECLQTSGFRDSEGKFSRLSRCLELSTVLSMRIFLLLIALFLLPTLLDIVCNRSIEGGPSRFNPRFHFQKNLKGEQIYMGKDASAHMTQHPERRVKAAIVVLARNKDVDDVLLSLNRLEERFNHKYLYPYVFLNDKEFDAAFINRTTAATNARTLYGQIPQEHWSYPSWISPQKAAAARQSMKDAGVLYGGLESYHHMCRYYSGFFYKHPLLTEFDYYWRMEPDVHYYCDLDYDPFLYMQENSMKYGFVISIKEIPETVPTLWQTTKAFMDNNPGLVPKDNLMPFVTAADGSYNLCHFWSNFEIGDLNFFRSKAYQKYFDHLDRDGGFFFERWGDAPVHSLAAAMLLNKTEVHFFQDIGYRHNSMKHCPATQRNNCACDAIESVSFHTPSFGICHKHWDDFVNHDHASS